MKFLYEETKSENLSITTFFQKEYEGISRQGRSKAYSLSREVLGREFDRYINAKFLRQSLIRFLNL